MSDSLPATVPPLEPRRPGMVAAGVYLVTTLALCWPMLQGRFLVNPLSDQFSAGYGFRQFAAEAFRAAGAIPEWNPFLFGGMPYIGAMHGDIFYPTAWLRLLLPVDTAMNLGFAVHLLLAGLFMYLLLRSLRLTWTGALVGGLAYQLSGIVASLVHPGHDGKLFVSALAPLAFLALVRAIRDRRAAGYGLLALTVGLAILSPHFQLTYYLLVAAGLWALYLVFLDPERPRGGWLVPLGASLGAVALGLALSAVQTLPFLEYIPFGARGGDAGWAYATSYALPIEELASTFLPEFNGVILQYWGQNPLKFHSEYLGVAVLLLALLAWGDRARRPLLWAFAAIGTLFLLVAFGGHTPFYRVWYEVMPMMKKVRAPGMAFFLFAFATAVFAAVGADRLLRREGGRTTLLTGLAVLGGLGLLGAAGLLQAVAETLAVSQRMEQVIRNADALRLGALRLLFFTALAGTGFWLVQAGRVRGWLAAAMVAGVLAADLWSVDRQFFKFDEPASRLFAEDPLLARMKETPPPVRVLDYGRVAGFGATYDVSHLMPHRVSDVLGYHGNELGAYDDLMGGKNVWENLRTPRLWDLLAVRFLVLPESVEVPGFRMVVPPTRTSTDREAALYERDQAPPYARVYAAAAKVPDELIVPTLMDQRFPLDRLLLYPDTASVSVDSLRGALPPDPAVRAALAHWEPGRIGVRLDGEDPRRLHLLVAENWYPDWRATVDGAPTTVLRGQGSLLSVVLPPGARAVELVFASRPYRVGRWISLAALLAIAGLWTIPLLRRAGGTRG